MPVSKPARSSQIVDGIKRHRVSLGVLLAAYGAFFLALVIMGGWTFADWGKDVPDLPPMAIQPLLPHSFIAPFFFVTAFPSLLAGAAVLCNYSIRGLFSAAVGDREHVALLLAVSGFAYVIVGAWPLQKVVDMPWEWQKQIMSYGPAFAWLLYLLGIVVLAVGGLGLLVGSRQYHRRHPELSVS